jgi:DNA-binding IclR family transcriptional regulator
MLDGDEIFLLDRVESSSPLRVQLFAGSRVPLHCSSAGKLFLAMLPKKKRSLLIRSAPLEKWTPNTITDPDKLEDELSILREAKMGRDNEEFLMGLVGIAVPVYDKAGRMCAAVSLNAPRARMDFQHMNGQIGTLRTAAESLSKTMF